MKTTKRRRILLLITAAVVLVSGVFLAGCGGSDEKKSGDLDKLTLQSLWLPQGQFAGVYVAKEKGFYEDEGIDLEILPGGTDVTSEDQVENDVAQIGTAFYSSVLTYQ